MNNIQQFISLIAPVQISSLTLEQDGEEILIVVGLSQKVKNFGTLIIDLKDSLGESVTNIPLEIMPHRTSKNISNTWAIRVTTDLVQKYLNEPLSLCIRQNNDSNLRHIEDTPLLFRDFFVHLNLQKKTFELPSSEIWIRDNTVIDNLAQVLNNDIENIKELIDFEKGLRFAVQRLRDLIRRKENLIFSQKNAKLLQYLTDGSQIDSINDIESQLEQLTNNLTEIDLHSHQAIHNKLLKSWQIVKFKWEKVYESGSLEWPIAKDKSEIADRHHGYFSC